MSLNKMSAERLASELLLSKGGGIYYDAARVAADESTATLFVGLGGTGADMLIRIKNEVKRRMVLPQTNGRISGDTPSNIGFIAFDTDKSTNEKVWGVASFDKYGSEFFSLSVDNIPAVVENRCRLVDQGDPMWQWYEKIPADIAVAGANGKRQIGRLLLFENARKVYDKIQTRVNELRRFGDGIKTVNVMLVTGISGGTGSGTFIDMAYLIRKALEDLDVQNKRIFGYIIMPDVNLLKVSAKERLSANAFASLKELDYWMCPEDSQHDAVFHQNYGQGIEVKIQRRVFDFCHLLSAQDFSGSPLSYDKVINSMAEFVFAYTAGEVGKHSGGNTAIDSMYDNIRTYMDDLTGEVSIPACYRYLAIGTHKLEIPYEEISTLLAIRLFERLEPIFALRPTEETFKADMKILRLIPKTVIHNSLTESIPPSPIDGNPNYQYTQIWGANNDSFNRNAAYYDVTQWYAREYQTGVTKNVGNFVNVHNGYFRDFVKDNMKKSDRGPMYLSALLKSDTKWSIIPTLDEVAQHCSDVSATCETKRGALEDALRREYNAGHGKIINKQKSVNSYIAALREWIENEAGVQVYAERSRVVRELRDRFALYYEKVFSKLADVIEALPDIFRQNMDYITIAQKEAVEAGLLDDTKLIWPMKFEQENHTEFEKLLKGACTEFLDHLTKNLSKWTGCDFETLEDKTGGNTDVPGFISSFISEQFGGLLNINMESIMRAKMGGADDLEDYLHTCLLRIQERSVPMFSIDAANRNLKMNEFAIASIPEDCLNIKSAAGKYYGSTVTIKVSKEKTRLYYVKVVSGIPLFAYSKIKDCAKYYKAKMSIEESARGTHICPDWTNAFPTPYPEKAWPMDYADQDIQNDNKMIRAAFDKCLEAGIIFVEEGGVRKRYKLKLANPAKTELLDTDLHGSIDERLEQLDEIGNELWGAETIVLPQMGNLSDGTKLDSITRESILRLPRISAHIVEQIKWLDAYKLRRNEVEDPRYFTFALLCGLITKKGFDIIIKRSLDSVISDTLYDTTQQKPFGEYETFLQFHKIADDKRRGEIMQIRTELLRRIGQGSPEKEETLARAEEILQQYPAMLPDAEMRVSKANPDKRKGHQDMLDFYQAVISITKTYKDRYLT